MQGIEVNFPFLGFHFSFRDPACPCPPYQHVQRSPFPVLIFSVSNPIGLLVGIQEWTLPAEALRLPCSRIAVAGQVHRSAEQMFWRGRRFGRQK